MSYYSTYETAITSSFANTQFRRHEKSQLSVDSGLEEWLKLTKGTQEKSGTIYFVGNGASATMASHMALDFTKNGGINALAFNDLAYLTAISNDISYDSVFAFPIQKFSKPEDLLIAISSSGGSPNIVEAAKAAREIGTKVVTLTGMKADNPVRQLGDLNVYVPAESYGIVECTHQILLHCWLDHFMGIEPR